MSAARRTFRWAKWLGGAILLAATAPGAPAAQTSRTGYFAAADRNGDGGLSLAEYQDWMSYAFVQMDRNGDGVLEPEEQTVPNAARLTIDELHARQADQFRRQDRDHDGRLSAAEFLAPPG